MLRAVLFDLDDTLVDHESAAASAVLTWAAEYGVTDAGAVARWAAVSDVHYSRYQRRELTFAEQRRERVREFLVVDIDDAEADDLFADYVRLYEAGWSVFDDAVPALRRARAAGLAVAVLTNGDAEHQRFKLQKLGLAEELDLFVASSTLPAGKPDPRAFQHATAEIDVDPADAMMVGNSLEGDVLGALGAGLSAVLLDRHNMHPNVDVPRVATLHELHFGRDAGPHGDTNPTKPGARRLATSRSGRVSGRS